MFGVRLRLLLQPEDGGLYRVGTIGIHRMISGCGIELFPGIDPTRGLCHTVEHSILTVIEKDSFAR